MVSVQYGEHAVSLVNVQRLWRVYNEYGEHALSMVDIQ